jgi:thiosulfate/3-mercaptopyruvate sulfurtransferase
MARTEMHMMKWILSALLIGAVAVASADAQTRDLPMLVDAEWVADNLDVPELIVVQVGEDRTEYADGHIAGSYHLPLRRIARSVGGVSLELLDPLELMLALREVGVRDDTYIVFYGTPFAAARAWMTVDFLGISDRVAILDGGIQSWREAGLPVSTELPAPRTGSFALWPQTQRVVNADWVLSRLEDPETVLLDARSLAEYTGEDSRGSSRAGRIPGARHLPGEELLRDGMLLDEDALRARFAAAGADPAKTLVIYGSSGERASLAYFAARMLGYQTRMYDGSWYDWSSRDLPIEAGRPTAGAN